MTLLRVGEANKAPLPPPPISGQAPPDEPARVSTDELQENLGADEQELKKAISPEPSVAHEVDGGDVAASKDKSHGKKASKMLAAVKSSIKGTVVTTLGADHLKAKAGSKQSKQRLGVIPRNRSDHLSGPVAFKCRYHGKRGHAYISTTETIPCIGFSLDKAIGKNGEDTLGKVRIPGQKYLSVHATSYPFSECIRCVVLRAYESCKVLAC